MTRPERERIAAILEVIWREALNVPSLRPTDDFFDLGGNSLQAIQIVSRIGDALDIELPTESVARVSRFADFCELVETSVGGRT